MTEPNRKPNEIPYLHVRPPKRGAGVGGVGDRPLARLHTNSAGLLKPRGHIEERALAAEEVMAAEEAYRETDEAELVVYRAPNRKQMGEPREPERPNRSMFN